MKRSYNMNELVFFKTRREARAYVLAAGKNTSAAIDMGTDKAVGARWAAVIVIAAPVNPVNPVKTLVLGARHAETLNTAASGRGHEVKVFKKRSYLSCARG